jgi:hypothetical protein
MNDQHSKRPMQCTVTAVLCAWAAVTLLSGVIQHYLRVRSLLQHHHPYRLATMDLCSIAMPQQALRKEQLPNCASSDTSVLSTAATSQVVFSAGQMCYDKLTALAHTFI